jgi:sugar lactone lactonase YvrE
MAMPHAEGFTDAVRGTTGLFGFDLETGELRHKHLVGSPQDQHGFDDLAVDGQGRVFVSDALSGGIWSTTADGKSLTPFLPAATFLNPNGLAVSADGRFLYVSDYPRDAILAVDTASRNVQPLRHEQTFTLYAADGLIADGQSLIIIQNGMSPYRIVRLTLDASGTRVDDSRILEMNNPRWDEPTLGTVADRELYYVGISQWSHFNDETGEPDLKALQEPVIFRLRLDP